MIAQRAPGKLFIAGEYAVVQPGEPSVLVAVDRFITVELRHTEHPRGRIVSDRYGRLPIVWTRHDDGIVVAGQDHRPYDFVLSAIAVVEQLVTELGRQPRFCDIDIASELDDASGRKFGLGSSAAVTVAVVRALDRFYDLRLGEVQLFKLALLASMRVSPSLSGGDVAASTFGGWIAYSAPNRDDVRRHYRRHGVTGALDRSWPGFTVRRLSPPAGVRLLVGWTGQPASTERLVGSLRHREPDDPAYRQFLADSRACVTGLVGALDGHDTEGILAAIVRARAVLAELARIGGLTIETPALRELCETALQAGAVAKSSGAGGGDCGIVLAPVTADVSRMLRAWQQSGIRHLPLAVYDGGAPGTPKDAEIRIGGRAECSRREQS